MTTLEPAFIHPGSSCPCFAALATSSIPRARPTSPAAEKMSSTTPSTWPASLKSGFAVTKTGISLPWTSGSASPSQNLPVLTASDAAQVPALHPWLSNRSQNLSPMHSSFRFPAACAADAFRSRMVWSLSWTTSIPGLSSCILALSTNFDALVAWVCALPPRRATPRGGFA